MISIDRRFFALLLLICVISGCKSFSRLGNRGGTVFTVEIQTAEPNRDEIVERAVQITQNKINAIGLEGEVTKQADYKIAVKLYDATDLEKIRKFLFTTYQLELKKVIGGFVLQTFPTKEAAEASATERQEVLPYQERDGSPSREQFIVVEKEAIINGDDIRDAEAASYTEQANDYQINFTLKPGAAQKFGDWTGKHIGHHLAIVLDKKVISAPVIQGQIFDQGVINGRFTKESAEDIALSLKSGYLPATMKVIEEKTF